MAFAPGHKKAGGRKKGVANKKTADTVKAIEASGLTPLEYMLQVMRDPLAKPERRDDMSKAAAPYVHPKLATVEHTGKDGGPIKQITTIRWHVVRPD